MYNDNLPVPISFILIDGQAIQVFGCSRDSHYGRRHYHYDVRREDGYRLMGDNIRTAFTYTALQAVLPNHHLVAGR